MITLAKVLTLLSVIGFTLATFIAKEHGVVIVTVSTAFLLLAGYLAVVYSGTRG